MFYDPKNTELRRQIQDRLQQLPPADWVQEMIAHYWRRGTVHPEDVRRLLGDPTRGVEVHPTPI
jgi:hypothetical protein